MAGPYEQCWKTRGDEDLISSFVLFPENREANNRDLPSTPTNTFTHCLHPHPQLHPASPPAGTGHLPVCSSARCPLCARIPSTDQNSLELIHVSASSLPIPNLTVDFPLCVRHQDTKRNTKSFNKQISPHLSVKNVKQATQWAIA